MAHKKAGGSSRNDRDSNAQRLGVKAFDGQQVLGGSILVRHASDHRLKDGNFKSVDLVSHYLAVVRDNARWTQMGPSGGNRIYVGAGVTRDIASGADAGYKRFRGEYDHLAVAADYFETARSLAVDREKAAQYALTSILCWEAYLYTGEFMENSTEEKERKAQQGRRTFARVYRATAFYKSYVREFGGGCPGIDQIQ